MFTITIVDDCGALKAAYQLASADGGTAAGSMVAEVRMGKPRDHGSAATGYA